VTRSKCSKVVRSGDSGDRGREFSIASTSAVMVQSSSNMTLEFISVLYPLRALDRGLPKASKVRCSRRDEMGCANEFAKILLLGTAHQTLCSVPLCPATHWSVASTMMVRATRDQRWRFLMGIVLSWRCLLDYLPWEHVSIGLNRCGPECRQRDWQRTFSI